MIGYMNAVCLLLSAIVIVEVASKKYSNIDIYFCSIMVIVPIILLGYWIKTTAISVDAARMAQNICYLDSTILPTLLLFSMLKSLKINVAKWVKVLVYGIAILHLFSIWVCRDNTLYYASFAIKRSAWGTGVYMTDGPLKFTHYIFVAAIAISFIVIMVYGFMHKQEYSRRSLLTYSGFLLVAIALYIIESVLGAAFTFLPVIYTIADIYLALNYESIHSHDIDCIVIDQQKEYTKRGYIAFDKKRRLLSYNKNALQYFNELKKMKVDVPLERRDNGGTEESLSHFLGKMLDLYQQEGHAVEELQRGDLFYRFSVMDFYMSNNGTSIGYLMEIQNSTAEHGYTKLIQEYGKSLESEVEKQTEQIKYIQNRVVLGMATIIENRDMNTGGHVRRTSDIIKIVVEEMQRQGVGDIDEKFADEVIRSAPMHDLGKISIDNNILCKPGKLTDEEYAIMKTHSAKSGEIVKAILSGVEDSHFVNTAYCLARFHHERWDGRGYPEGLMEDEIPLEARIMAVADVYDALVSKRCYKEAMSFDKAAQIMVEGMGSQFDPQMKSVFLGCQSKLEDYYREHSE